MSAIQQLNNIFTPQTEQWLFTEQILIPILRGENVTVIEIPHSGTRKQMIYLLENSHSLGFHKLGKYSIYYLNPDDLTENSSNCYFSLFLSTVEKKILNTKEPFLALKGKIQELLQDERHLIFILGKFDKINFDPIFFNNLASLWQIKKTHIHFIFNVDPRIFDGENLNKYEQLSELLLQNKVYFPLFSKFDSEIAMNNLIRKYGYAVSIQQKLLTEKLGGGHPTLIKLCLKTFTENPNIVKEDEAINLFMKKWETQKLLADIWNSFSGEEQNLLAKIANKETYQATLPEALSNLGIIKISNNNPILFSSLFQSYIQSKGPSKSTLSFDEVSGEILLNGRILKEKLTFQERRLLSSLLRNPLKLFTREEIAEILWGNNSYDKYSDWAIDQRISLLRKKLHKIGIPPKNLQTLKSLGYRWVM